MVEPVEHIVKIVDKINDQIYEMTNGEVSWLCFFTDGQYQQIEFLDSCIWDSENDLRSTIIIKKETDNGVIEIEIMGSLHDFLINEIINKVKQIKKIVFKIPKTKGKINDKRI
jgi:hypothetical protein